MKMESKFSRLPRGSGRDARRHTSTYVWISGKASSSATIYGAQCTVASGQTLTIAGELASTSNIGVASFTSSNFTVTSGDVAITTVDGGSF